MKSKKTKRALVSSALALVLCFVMLLGTTFAWFTDNASTSVNKVQAGTLDVALEMWDATAGEEGKGDWVSAEGKTLDFIAKDGNKNILWEPGATYKLPTVRIVNNGNLAIKYKVVVTAVKGDTKLAEVLDVLYTDSELKITDKNVGTLKNVLGSTDEDGFAHGNLIAGAESGEITLKLHMQESAGNTYQGLAIDGIAITVNATQYTEEYDSKDNQYDKDANFAFAWDGVSSDTTGLAANTDDKAKTVTINNAAQLKAFADAVAADNRYFGYTVTLTADIDLSGQIWPGIGADNYGSSPSGFFNGTFDGQGHTIYNMTVSNLVGSLSVAGFFNGLGNNAIVKNLNFENASVTSNHEAGVVAGYCNVTNGNGVVAEPKACIENCHVSNSRVTSVAHQLANGTYDDGDKAGGIVGFMYYDVKNCSVTDTTIQGVRDLGGIAGIGYGSVSGCSIENVTIVRDASKIDRNENIDDIVGRKENNCSPDNCTGEATKTTLYAVSSSSAEEIATALKATTETINVTLTGDVTVDSDSGTKWTEAFGGDETETIVIDGQGKYTLNFNQTDSDWSHVATNGGKLVLKNLKLTNSGYNSGPWNQHDIVFDCEVEMENVTSDKAIALGKNAKLTNVTINETGDVYALWITADGQTVTLNNVTINCPNGRAIAIKDQYVDTPAKVTLNISNSKISSAKKAAVLVTSTAGAAITASNVDISGVSADSTNLVWYEKCNSSDISVNGGFAIVEP